MKEKKTRSGRFRGFLSSRASTVDLRIIIDLSVLRLPTPNEMNDRRYWTLASVITYYLAIYNYNNVYIRYFVSIICTSASIDRRNRLRIRSIADRPVSTGFHSIFLSSTSWLQKFLFPPCLGFLLMCMFESSCSIVLRLLRSISLSVSCRTRVCELERQDRLATLACN